MSDATSSENGGSLIDGFTKCRVLCIGDIMLDRYVYGHIDRISPEAPIPVFSVHEKRLMLGGAGNVTRNLAALGAHTTFIAVTGNDKTGHEITSLIGKESQISPFLIQESGRLSTLKTRYVAGNQQVLRADHETAVAVQEETARRILATVTAEMANQDVVILSDYGKGVLTRETIAAIIALAKQHKKPVLVDPKSRDFSMYAHATCISPNLHELSVASGRDMNSEDDITAAARELLNKHNIEAMLVTRSSKGMTLVPRTGEVHHIPARAQEVFDVSGAGDTAIATFALGVASGMPLAEAAKLANIAAGIVVGRLGTAVITVQDLKNSLLAAHDLAGMEKIMPFAAAVAQAEQWKREGKIVGFTNGCYDLIHRGHISMLNTCKEYCDKLILGLNTDASVKRLKGPTRPVNSEQDRALLLASLAVVDGVVLFSEDTPVNLIKALRPDVLIKGADYQKHQVVGHEIVEGYGGKIVLAPLKEGYSTTGIIGKLAG